MRGSRPRVLVTGFTPFPGAPVNPTEWLMDALARDVAISFDFCDLRTAVLPVDYRHAGAALKAVADIARPDIVIHFGLAQDARGFRLERLARNEVGDALDNRGFAPGSSAIAEGRGHAQASLPLATIAEALSERGLPVEWSDDAGGYLCNYVFFHTAAGLCAPLATARSGFVHVPLFGDRLTREQMLLGARLIIETSAACL